MKARWVVLAVVAVGATLAWTNAVQSVQDDERKADASAQPQAADDMQKAMADWMESLKPGASHKRLDHFVGDWDVEMKVWMGGPGSEPTVTPGKSTIKWVLGGLYLQEEYKGSMMGQPYEGIGMQGFNNTRNMYEGTWASSMDTHIYTMKGTWPPDSKVINYYGEMDEPMLNVYGRTVNYRTTILSKDKHRFEIFDLAVAPDFKVIELVYTRR